MLGTKALPALMDHQATREFKDQLVSAAHEAHRGLLVTMDHWAHLAHLATKVQRDRKEILAIRVRKAHRALLAKKD